MSEELETRIRDALWSLVHDVGATIPAIRLQPDLMTLDCAIAYASADSRATVSPEDVAVTVAHFLEEIADSLEQEPNATTIPNKAKAARAALGLKAELHGRPFRGIKGREGRQRAIAEWLDVDKGRLETKHTDGTSPLGDMIDPIAAFLTQREVDYRVNERHRAQRARRPPLESAMRVEWLGRFERYFKMWGPISGLRYDLEMALHYLQRDESIEAETFIRKSLFYYARYLVELERFVTQHGGLWVLPDTRTEDAIADSTWFIRRPIPSGEVNDSILSMTYARAPELALFMHATYASQHLQPVLRTWREWIHSCRCRRPKCPRQDCDVHATIEWCRFYMDALEAQWDFLADWYDLPRPGTKIDPVKQARSNHPVFPPSLPVDTRIEKS